MRITNSMMINNVLSDLNSGLIRQNKYFQQLASNRKMVNLSDNPIGLVNSLNARQNLRQIEQYRSNIVMANKWTQQAETQIMDIQSILVKVKENVVDAGGTKNPSDKGNISTLVKELKQQIFETLNATTGDKYIFGGFNSTKKPFTMDKDGNVLYNGINLADSAPKAGTMIESGDVSNPVLKGGINPPDEYTIKPSGATQIQVTNASGSLDRTIDLTDAKIKQTEILDEDGNATGRFKNSMEIEANGLKLGTLEWETEIPESDSSSTREDAIKTLASIPDGKISCGLYDTMTQIVIDPETETTRDTSISWEGPITGRDKYYIEANGADITIKDSNGTEIVKTTIPDNMTELDLSQYGLGKITRTGSGSAEDIASAIESVGYVTTKLGEEASQNIQFEIGYQIKIDATFTGIDVVGLGENNIFKVLDDLIADLDAGANNDVLTKYHTRLADLQNQLLTCAVELGARTNKLDTMENRYSLENINAEAVRGDIEDIDQAQTIMNMKFAEAIYKQALACGAMIIQPTLMDFLR